MDNMKKGMEFVIEQVEHNIQVDPDYLPTPLPPPVCHEPPPQYEPEPLGARVVPGQPGQCEPGVDPS
eukprot:2272935-Prorocentrum_lima.AAC.1